MVLLMCFYFQNAKVDKLKTSLDEAMKSHKKAMDDNEKLLVDLKKANMQLRVSKNSLHYMYVYTC